MVKHAGYLVCVLALLPAALRAAEQASVLVFPLDGPAEMGVLEWLGEAVAVSISDQLRGPQLKPMERSERVRLVENLDLPPGARLSRGSMIRVAQGAGSDLVVMGSYSGTEQSLRIALRVLDLKTLKLSGEMVANGPLSALPQMENELAWLILNNNGLEETASRQKFQERTRKVPNSAYSYYIQSLYTPAENDQIRLLQRAIQGYRLFPDAHSQLGRLYFRKGDCANALRHLQLSQNQTRDPAESDFIRGTCHIQTGQPQQAIQIFARLLQVSQPFEVLNNMGVAHLRNSDTASAISVLKEARNLIRNDPTVTLNLALAHHLQGNPSAAGSILDETVKVHPENGMLQFMTSVVLKAQGESQKAQDANAKARKLGIKTERLQAEDPKKWARVLFDFEP